MVNIRERAFIICGADFFARKQALANIKKRVLKAKPASLNTITFYPKETSVQSLQDKLLNLSFSGVRIAVFKDFLKLSPAVKELFLNSLNKILENNYIVFETESSYYQLQRNKKTANDKFFGAILKKAALFRVSSAKRESTIGDFIESISRRDLPSSLYILESLFDTQAKSKALGPQVIGVLVNKFGACKDGSSLEYLWQADRAIKEKGRDTRLVIETLLVKLLKNKAAA